MNKRSRKIKYFWKMANEVEFKDGLEIKASRAKEVPFKVERASTLNDFDYIYIDGKKARKADLINPLDKKDVGYDGLWARKNMVHSLYKLQRTDWSNATPGISLKNYCKLLKELDIKELNCQVGYEAYKRAKVDAKEGYKIVTEFHIKKSIEPYGEDIEPEHIRRVLNFILLPEEFERQSKKVADNLSNFHESEISPNAKILPFFQNIDWEDLNLSFSDMYGSRAYYVDDVSKKILDKAESEWKVVNLSFICSNENGNIYYDLSSGKIIEDDTNYYGKPIKNSSVKFINTDFKLFVNHYDSSKLESITRDKIKKLKRDICGLAPANIRPQSARPEFSPLCSSPEFKNTPYCQNIKEIKEFCKANPDAPICANPDSIMSEIKSGWDWMCNLEPFKSQAICGVKKKKEIAKKDDFDLPDSVHTWKEPSGMSFCDKNPNHPNCKG